MSELADAIERLVDIVARLQRIDLWPPWDAAQSVVDAVAAAVTVLTRPPAPSPDALLACAAGWTRAAGRLDQAAADLRYSGRHLDEPGVWEGEAGDGCRSSVAALAGRLASVPRAATAVSQALRRCADEMTAARELHRTADDELRRHLHISWSDLNPVAASAHLEQVVTAAIAAVQQAIQAYRLAETAVEECQRTVTTAMDEIDLPTALAPGVDPVTQTNAMSGGGANDTGPLRGNVAERASAALAAMTPAERAAVLDLLAHAAHPDERDWILAAVASGLTGPALDNFAHHLAGLTQEQRALLDPTVNPNPDGRSPYIQPDGTTCGSSSLVFSRMLNDPAYAMSIALGYDPRTDAMTGDPADIVSRFQQAAVTMHSQTNGLTDHDGDFNGWWPEAAGTSPGSAARQMGGGAGLSGVPGASYDVHYVDSQARAAAFADIRHAVDAGHTVPLYVYDVQNSAGDSGAHVLLVYGTSGGSLVVYDPGDGKMSTIDERTFVSAQLGGELGWDRPLATILPVA